MMRNAVVMFATALGLAAAAPAFPQAAPAFDGSVPYSVTSWTDQDGLPSNQIRAIAQDSQGYLWLGTGAGLVRFDGVTFTAWQGNTSPPLPDAEVTSVCAARDGSLWIATTNGEVIRLRGGQASTFTAADGLPRGVYLHLFQDHEGTIWAGGGDGISRLRNDRWERVLTSDGTSPQSVFSFYEDRRRNLWIGTTSAILVRRVGSDGLEQVEASEPARSISEDNDGAVWVTDPMRGARRVIDVPGLRGEGFDGENGSSMIHDRNGTQWLGTANGVLHIAPVASSQRRQVERFQAGTGLANDSVLSLFEDREGNIWAGTEGGLTRLSRRPIKSLTGPGITNNVVRSLVAARDGVWAATANGLVQFLPRSRRIFGKTDGLPSADITALHQDTAGVLWIGTVRGMARLVNGRISPVVLPQDLSQAPILALTTDRGGALWFSYADGRLLEWKAGMVSEANHLTGGNFVRSAFTDTGGRMWLGFRQGGVSVVSNGEARFYSERDGLAGGRVDAIFEDRTGTVWVGTANGLSRFDGNRFRTLGVTRLRARTISAIVDDESGRLWLSTSAGIIRLDPREFERAVSDAAYRMQTRLYETGDGAGGPPGSLLLPSAARAADGTIWMVTASGIAVIDPLELPEHRSPPAARIEEITVDQRTVNPEQQQRVPPLTSRLEIRFAALMLSPPRLRFRYMLEGFDSDWIDAGLARQAIYTNLQPGEYRFRVTSGNGDGVWNESAATWAFVLAPAFYQTRWFLAACGLSVLLMIGGVWQWRAARHHARLAEMRSDFVASVTHDLKTPIAAIRAAGETLISGRAPLEAKREYAQLIVKEAKRLTRSVDNLLAFSRISDVGSGGYRQRLSPDTLIHETLEDFRPQLTDGGFEVTLDIGAQVPEVMADPAALSLVLHNLVDNAIRYSGTRRQIALRAQAVGQQVVIEVSDRGEGIPRDEVPLVTRKFYRGRNAKSSGSGLGLAIAKRVVGEHGGTLTIVSTEGVGTTIRVALPASGDMAREPGAADAVETPT